MMNTLNIAEVFSLQDVRFLGKKLRKLCIVFSNGAHTHTCEPGTFKLHTCVGNINTEGRVSHVYYVQVS